VKAAPLPDTEIVADVGLTVMPETFPITVAEAVALRASALAVIVVVPDDTPVRMALPVPVTVAMPDGLLDQLTPLVSTLRVVLPLLSV
jgi:hypothetical protein